jgi:phosphate transport system ATP-binding protein
LIKPHRKTQSKQEQEEQQQVHKVTIKNLEAWFGTKQALKNINLDVKEKTVTPFIGPSGCGKTTLIRCLSRMHEMTPGAKAKGQVIIDAIDIYDRNIDPVIIKRRIGMVFQKPNPFPTICVFIHRMNILYIMLLNEMCEL